MNWLNKIWDDENNGGNKKKPDVPRNNTEIYDWNLDPEFNADWNMWEEELGGL